MTAYRVCGVAAALLVIVGASAPASKDAAPPSVDQPVMLAVVNATYQDFLDDLAAAWAQFSPKFEYLILPLPEGPNVYVYYVSPDDRLRVLALPNYPTPSFLHDWLLARASVHGAAGSSPTDLTLPLAGVGFPHRYPTVAFFQLDDSHSAVLAVASNGGRVAKLADPLRERYFAVELPSSSRDSRMGNWQPIHYALQKQAGKIVLDTTSEEGFDRPAPQCRRAVWVVASESGQQRDLMSLLSAAPASEWRQSTCWNGTAEYAANEQYLYPPLADERALEFCHPAEHGGASAAIVRLGDPDPSRWPFMCRHVEINYVVQEVSKWDTILAGFFELRNGSVEVLLFRGYKEPLE